jgi:hypothetical protein
MGNSDLTPQDIKYNVFKRLYEVETSKEVKLKLLKSMLEITTEKVKKNNK